MRELRLDIVESSDPFLSLCRSGRLDVVSPFGCDNAESVVLALELDSGADSAEAGPDDQGLDLLRTHGTTIYAVPPVLLG